MSEDPDREEQPDADPPPLLYDPEDKPLPRSDGCKEKWQRRFGSLPWVNTAFSGFLLVATVVQAVILIYHWQVMRNDVKVSRKSVRQVAQTVAEARESNRLQQRAIENENRAILVADHIDPISLVADKETRISIRIKNFGNSIARNVRVASDRRGLPPDHGFNPIERPFSETAGRGILGPDDTQISSFTIPQMSYEDVERYRTGKVILYIFGYGSYDDLFVEERLFSFCYYWVPVGESWGICDRYNESP